MKRNEVDRTKLSPMMRQYMDIKDEYQDELLFFRLGDFYELFFEDGETASRELELTLTGKSAGLDERVPMCGVPFHSVKPYIEKLVNKGYRVAICEQLEDPKSAKDTVKRGVVDVISKGTITDNELLDERNNSYIASILEFSDIFIITYADISTGELNSLSIENNLETLISEVLNLGIKEVVLLDNLNVNLVDLLKNKYNIDVVFNSEYLTDELEYLEILKDPRKKAGVKHLFYYLVVKELKSISHFNNVNEINKESYLEMDVHSVRNLELFETIRLKERAYSLIWLLDKCKTAMGSRKLKTYLMHPLKNIDELNKRYDKIEILNNNFILKDELKGLLYEIYDIERLCGKITSGSVNGRDLLQLKNSLKVLPRIKEILGILNFDDQIETHQDIYLLLEASIYENPPIGIKEGYLIKDGYSKELDELKSIRSGGKDFLAEFESKIKNETGIKNLRVGFNKVFGYYIEVSKGQAAYVKDNFGWERRQTLTNCERFISPELKEKEALILNAEEKIIDLEYNLFIEVKNTIKKEVLKIKKTADSISNIDAILSLSVCSEELNLVRPSLNNEKKLEIIDGRHPVVEIVSGDLYVPNDCHMDNNASTLLITGPNMSGKSTYMRQIAIIILMAQMGSFVPAKSANLPIIDKIFTRIGASDDLVSGESTFMVEMKEARNAIMNATQNSLIIFDELGRGTATYDGMSLAGAILEYISENIKALTLFSTHYHELTSLEKKYKTIKNVHVSAVENNGSITFLHKVKNGAIDKSYGIHVARLAGMPEDLLKRADEMLNEYESNNKKVDSKDKVQLAFDLFSEKEEKVDLKKKIESINPLEMTPMEALNYLYELKNDIK
jgi:DNA mismatch repair protein MutS